MILTAFSLALAGFTALSLAMKRHLLQVQPQRLLMQDKRPSKQQVWIFRTVGYFCLLLSGVFCIADQGIAVGLVSWTGLFTLAALLQSLLLTYRPSWVMPIGLTALVLSAVTALAAS